MKKVLSFILSLALILSCVGCSGKKEDEARIEAERMEKARIEAEKEEEARVEAEKKEAGKKLAGEIFSELNEVYETVDTIGTDIYQVWTISSTKSKDVVADPIAQLAKNTHLDESDIALGAIVALDVVLNAKAPGDKESIIEGYREKSDEMKEEFVNISEDEDMQAFFLMIFQSASPLSDLCVYTTQDAYNLKGSFSDIQERLDALKDQIKQLNTDYPDFEAFEDLKNIYTQTSVYYEFCLNPKGSLVQAIDTINEYRNSVKASKAELEFVF